MIHRSIHKSSLPLLQLASPPEHYYEQSPSQKTNIGPWKTFLDGTSLFTRLLPLGSITGLPPTLHLRPYPLFFFLTWRTPFSYSSSIYRDLRFALSFFRVAACLFSLCSFLQLCSVEVLYHYSQHFQRAFKGGASYCSRFCCEIHVSYSYRFQWIDAWRSAGNASGSISFYSVTLHAQSYVRITKQCFYQLFNEVSSS